MLGGKGKHLHCRKTKAEKKSPQVKQFPPHQLVRFNGTTEENKKLSQFYRKNKLSFFLSFAFHESRLVRHAPNNQWKRESIVGGSKTKFSLLKRNKKKARKENLICPIIESRSAIKRSPSKSSARRKVARSRTIFGGKILCFFGFHLKGFPRAVKTRIRWL